ncbi:Small RNA 2'-O-methyltransferase, partial [Dissophora globulifera]
CYTLHARIDYPIYDVVHTEDEILTFLLDKIAHIRPRPSRPVSENGDDYYSLWERRYDNADDGQLESTPDIGIVVTAAEDGISTPTEDEINDRDREIGLGVLLLDDLWTSLDVRQRCKTRAAMVRILQKSTLVRVDEEQDKVLWDEEGDAFWREWDKEYAKQFERDDNDVDLQSLRDDEQEEDVGYYESEGYARAEADGETSLQDDGTTMGDFQSSRAEEWGTTGWSRRSTEYQDSDDEDSPWRTPVIPESGGSGPTAWDIIEHLDSDVLDKFWGVVLGALRPKVVIVSTPNAEFNIYFPQLKYGTAEAIFRNDDHRFEWTRQEFQDWCTPAAEQYGYSVTFTGVGRLPNSDPEVGHCTQFAILERQAA